MIISLELSKNICILRKRRLSDEKENLDDIEKIDNIFSMLGTVLKGETCITYSDASAGEDVSAFGNKYNYCRNLFAQGHFLFVQGNMGVSNQVSDMEGDGYGMDYPTSEAGLMFGLTKSIAQYGSKYGIRCVCVSPGPVLTRAAMANMKTLLGRAAEPQEIIDLILFIASDKGQFINGENIMIDGGRNASKRERK